MAVPSRTMKRQGKPSLVSARRKASRASVAGTPATSKSTAPGLMIGDVDTRPVPCPAPSGLQGLLGDRFVRENTRPHLALALEVTVDRHTRGLDLVGGQLGRGEGLDAEFAKRKRVAARGLAGHRAFLLLAIFGAGGLERHGEEFWISEFRLRIGVGAAGSRRYPQSAFSTVNLRPTPFCRSST